MLTEKYMLDIIPSYSFVYLSTMEILNTEYYGICQNTIILPPDTMTGSYHSTSCSSLKKQKSLPTPICGLDYHWFGLAAYTKRKSMCDW